MSFQLSPKHYVFFLLKTRKSADWLNLFRLLGIHISISSGIQEDEMKTTKGWWWWWWWYSCCRQLGRVRKRAWASNQAQCISSTLYFTVIAECDAVWSRHYVFWAKQNTTFLAANYLWDEIKGGTVYCASTSTPSAPPGPAAREKTSPPPFVSPCTELYTLLFLSSGPTKTWELINQCQELTPSSRCLHLSVVTGSGVSRKLHI